jgi:hypothetical protein
MSTVHPGLLVTVENASQGSNYILRLWQIPQSNDSEPRSVLLANTTASNFIAFNPDGRTLLTVDNDGVIHQLPLQVTDLIGRACAIAGRSLQWNEWRDGFGRAEYHSTCVDIPHASYIDHQLDEADLLAEQGEMDAALATYADIQRQSPRYVVGAQHWNKLCQTGIFWDRVKDVLEACGKVVAIEPTNGPYHGHRGLARALTGDANGAIEDFEAYIARVRLIAAEKYQSRIAIYTQWIADLKAGKPFNVAQMKALIKDELNAGD